MKSVQLGPEIVLLDVKMSTFTWLEVCRPHWRVIGCPSNSMCTRWAHEATRPAANLKKSKNQRGSPHRMLKSAVDRQPNGRRGCRRRSRRSRWGSTRPAGCRRPFAAAPSEPSRPKTPDNDRRGSSVLQVRWPAWRATLWSENARRRVQRGAIRLYWLLWLLYYQREKNNTWQQRDLCLIVLTTTRILEKLRMRNKWFNSKFDELLVLSAEFLPQCGENCKSYSWSYSVPSSWTKLPFSQKSKTKTTTKQTAQNSGKNPFSVSPLILRWWPQDHILIFRV